MRSLLTLVAFLPTLALAQPLTSAPAEGPLPEHTLVLPFSVVDVPQAAQLGYHWPTWEQSLEVNKAQTQGGHALIHLGFSRLSTAWWSKALELVSTTVFDFLMVSAPGGDGWLHEEGHRAVMFAAGVPSRQVFNNWAYRPEEHCDSGSVCGMTDENIAAVKARRSADWVRVQEAGMETELEQVRRLEKDVLFYDQPRYQNIPVYALYLTSVLAYRQVCATPGSFTNEDVLGESADIGNRDFTGPDCTGWVTDLFRPDEPYADRGPHPLGGVRRIRLYDDLSGDERKYLQKMRNLGFLNLVDPHVFGFPGFELSFRGNPTRVNAALGHHLTSFGDAFTLGLFARQQQLRLYGELMLFRNHTGHFPGVRLELVRHPIRSFRPLYLSASVWAWAQPRNQAFYDNTMKPGGAVEASLSMPLFQHLELFAAVGGKSEGWVVAKPSLDAAVDARLGFNLVF